MLWDCFAERTKSRTAATIKPQLSHSPPGVYLYSVLLKISDLSFVDIAWSKGKSLVWPEKGWEWQERCAEDRRGLVYLYGGSVPPSEEQAVPPRDNGEHNAPPSHFWNSNLQGRIHVFAFRRKPKASHIVVGFVHTVFFWEFHSPPG